MPTRERLDPDYMTREEIEYEVQDRGMGDRPGVGAGQRSQRRGLLLPALHRL